MKPRIAVTMGDPAGIGPEICLDLLSAGPLHANYLPIVFGDRGVLEKCAEATGRQLATNTVAVQDLRDIDRPGLLEITALDLDRLIPGKSDSITGAASYQYISKATEACLRGDVDAMTTCPASKAALHEAGIIHPGHTEILAELTGSRRSCMMFFSEVLICSLVTIHVGFREVPALLNEKRISEVIELTRDAVRKLKGKEPLLAVCGLNPHAGENGLFGAGEEERSIIPAILSARAAGCRIVGPLPPDTAFIPEARERFDGYICMYHDQALIPLKTLAFDRAVNVTLGLPIVRTSVDHGTAPDIAWQGRANPRSLIEAVALAARMTADAP